MGMDTFGWQAEHTNERCVTAAVDFITWPSRLMLHCGYAQAWGTTRTRRRAWSTCCGATVRRQRLVTSVKR